MAGTVEGVATVEAYKVRHDRRGVRSGIVVGRLEDGDARFLALVTDEATLDLLGRAEEPVGATVHATTAHGINTVTSS